MKIELYEVKLVKAWSHERGGKSFCLPSSSHEAAVQAVLKIEPYYNPDWGITVCKVINGKRQAVIKAA